MSNTVRVTIDLPKKEHRKLKTTVALLGTSLQSYIRGCIGDQMYSDHIPNAETRRVLDEIKAGKNLTAYKSVEDLLKKLEE